MSDKTDYQMQGRESLRLSPPLRIRKPGWKDEPRGLRRGLDVKRISPPPAPIVLRPVAFKAYSPMPGVLILPAGHSQCFEAVQAVKAKRDRDEADKTWGWEQKRQESNERIAERFAEIRQQYNRRQTTPMGGK